MKTLYQVITAAALLNLSITVCHAECASTCCQNLGGIHYCDSSAGRYVCKNGDYSACYCTRHAIMDLQKLQGCCLWQGGVLKIDNNLVICRNGTLSEICALGQPEIKTAIY